MLIWAAIEFAGLYMVCIIPLQSSALRAEPRLCDQLVPESFAPVLRKRKAVR